MASLVMGAMEGKGRLLVILNVRPFSSSQTVIWVKLKYFNKVPYKIDSLVNHV